MSENLKINWPVYLMEFFGLAGFVLAAGLLTIFLEHPDFPVMKSTLKDFPLLRRIPLGIIMGGYITAVILLFGKKSGAQVNPSVTWTFFRLGKINFTNAVFFTIAQFAGAISAALLLKCTLGVWFGHPLINNAMSAFAAEFIISFILMLVVLMAGSSRRFEKYVAPVSGILIALYLIIEIPWSGMSLNPARSFAGALAADEWSYLWIYFLSPTVAMLTAAEVFLQWKKNRLSAKKNDYKDLSKVKYMYSDYHEIPNYPAEHKYQ